jgi:hypothetical protein
MPSLVEVRIGNGPRVSEPGKPVWGNAFIELDAANGPSKAQTNTKPASALHPHSASSIRTGLSTPFVRLLDRIAPWYRRRLLHLIRRIAAESVRFFYSDRIVENATRWVVLTI